jgi:hypothetical protein
VRDWSGFASSYDWPAIEADEGAFTSPSSTQAGADSRAVGPMRGSDGRPARTRSRLQVQKAIERPIHLSDLGVRPSMVVI